MPETTAFLSPVFVAPQPKSTPLAHKSRMPVMATNSTRRAFLSFASSALLLAIPQSSQAQALSRDEAEREARLAYASLSRLSDLIDLEDYNSFRVQLRTGAMSRVRASCNAWYRSFEPTDQRAVTGEKTYRGLIKAVEAADIAALKAERGGDHRKVPELVRNIGARFDEFLGAVDG